MINWDREFLKKLKQLGIEIFVYERFKDDITIVVESLEAGTKYEDDSIVNDPEKKIRDEDKSNEEITMNVLNDVANSMDAMIQFTVDFPTNHKSGRVPILDVQASISEEKQNKIEFEYYEKPTRNKKVILSDSALTAKQKRTILTQECLRRLRNTQKDLGGDIQKKNLNNFMVKMKNSGYGAKYRKEILDSSYKAFNEMIKADQLGEKPLYRSKYYKKDIREDEKIKKRKNWYKNGQKETEYITVLFVPITKGGLLAKELRKHEYELNRNSKYRIKIVENGGIQLKNFLIQKDPFPKLKCDRIKCIICNSEESETLKFSCNSNNVGYQIGCDTCLERGKSRVYEGESSRSARIRGAEHLADFEKMRPKSVLWKHKLTEHPDEEMKFKMKITKKYQDPLSRQANEAVRISFRNQKAGELLNSKSEFNHPPISRVMVEKRSKSKIWTESIKY